MQTQISRDWALTLTMTSPVYKIPNQLMAGLEGKQFLYNNKDDKDEVTSVVEAAYKVVLLRTGGAGFPLLCDGIDDSQIEVCSQERGF